PGAQSEASRSKPRPTPTPAPAPTPAASGSVQHVPFTRVSQNHAAIRNDWSTGEPRLVKDRTPGSARELFGFGWPIDGSDRQVYLYKSGDNGQSWSFVNPPAEELTQEAEGIVSTAQDSSGQVHIIYKDGGWGVMRYVRVLLTHDAQGAI